MPYLLILKVTNLCTSMTSLWSTRPQDRRQLNWIGGGGDIEVELRAGGAFTCYISASIAKKVFAKKDLRDRHGGEKLGSGGLAPRKLYFCGNAL